MTVLQGFSTGAFILDKKFGHYRPTIRAVNGVVWIGDLVGKVFENDTRTAIPHSNLQPRHIFISDLNYTTGRDTMVAIISEMCRQVGSVTKLSTGPWRARGGRGDFIQCTYKNTDPVRAAQMLNFIPLTRNRDGGVMHVRAVPKFCAQVYCKLGLSMAAKKMLEISSVAMGEMGVSIQLFEESRVRHMLNGWSSSN